MNGMKKVLSCLLGCGLLLSAAPVMAQKAEPQRPAIEMNEVLTRDFKTFSVRDSVKMFKVSFSNIYGMKVAGALFMPKELTGKAPAIVIGHPMGAVKEQAACVYGAEMASRGFVTLAMDQIFWGESSGQPRHGIAPDLYAETFCAAVDFLGTRKFVDREKIGILGICGSGSFVISAAKLDPRMKAVATVSMYNIGEMRRSGLKKSLSVEKRKQIIADAAALRYAAFEGAEQVFTGGAPFTVDENSPATRKHSHAFYHGRGEFIPEGEPFEINTRSDKITNAKFMNFYPFNDIETISPRPMLFIMGEKAHSRPFTEDAMARAAEPKELVVIKNAGHFDLYDKMELIPFDKLEKFYRDNLK